MKLSTAFAILFFLTTAAQAQLYPGYPNSFYAGVTQPYYPQSYYPVPFGLPNYSQPDPLVVQQPVSNKPISSNNETTDSVRRQVQQLTEQVNSLQVQLRAAQERAQFQQSETSAALTKPTTPVVVVLKNGKVLETQGYAVAGDTLWILTRSGRVRIALSDVNVPATQEENLKRGINFPNLES